MDFPVDLYYADFSPFTWERNFDKRKALNWFELCYLIGIIGCLLRKVSKLYLKP